MSAALRSSLVKCVAIVLAGLVQGQSSPAFGTEPTPVRLEVHSVDCDPGLQITIESQILKHTSVKITKKNASHRMTITCHWEQSPPFSTSFYSSWGNADLAVTVEELADESTVYAESITQGAKSRGLAMKKAAVKMVNELIRAKVFPKK